MFLRRLFISSISKAPRIWPIFVDVSLECVFCASRGWRKYLVDIWPGPARPGGPARQAYIGEKCSTLNRGSIFCNNNVLQRREAAMFRKSVQQTGR